VGAQGVPLYPLFQLSSTPINRPGDQPPHSTDIAPWTMAPAEPAEPSEETTP
jgi:hypothetical protein